MDKFKNIHCPKDEDNKYCEEYDKFFKEYKDTIAKRTDERRKLEV